MATYSLFAIRYATAEHRRRLDNFLPPPPDPHDAPMPMDFFVWVAVGGGRTVLIDTGADRNLTERRGNRFLICPADALRSLGITPERIDTVIATHLHWDHAGNVRKFPAARFHAQECEMQYAYGPCMCHPLLRRPYDVEQACDFVRLLYEDRLVLHAGEAEIAPGISVRRLPGHTPGLQSVTVETQRGTVVLASDAAHFYDNFELRRPFPVVTDMSAYLDSLVQLERLAGGKDRLIPGHDPAVMTLYPVARPGLEDLAVRLDVKPSRCP